MWQDDGTPVPLSCKSPRDVIMKITGVVAEYNPFHAGHEYQLKMARKLSDCTCIAVAMSGNYVQRGEPSILDKYNFNIDIEKLFKGFEKLYSEQRLMLMKAMLKARLSYVRNM